MCILFYRQEKERDEMLRRQTRDLTEFYKKIEQIRKNDKLAKDSKRSGSSTSTTTKTTTTTQTVHEQKSSNGHSIKTTVAKKQVLHSDENLKKLQQRSMQQFEFDASKKRGGGGAIGGWSTNKHTFNQMKGQPTTAPMVMKGPRVVVPTSSSSMPHIPQSAAGYIPHTSSSMVFATPQQNNAMHGNLPGQMHTGVYWTNGTNQNWQGGNIETGNGRGQPVAYPDAASSWQTNGPYHPVATQPQQMVQANNPPRTDSQMTTDNSKHVVLPSR